MCMCMGVCVGSRQNYFSFFVSMFCKKKKFRGINGTVIGGAKDEI
jgi:hypothetical protein